VRRHVADEEQRLQGTGSAQPRQGAADPGDRPRRQRHLDDQLVGVGPTEQLRRTRVVLDHVEHAHRVPVALGERPRRGQEHQAVGREPLVWRVGVDVGAPHVGARVGEHGHERALATAVIEDAAASQRREPVQDLLGLTPAPLEERDRVALGQCEVLPWPSASGIVADVRRPQGVAGLATGDDESGRAETLLQWGAAAVRQRCDIHDDAAG
jgi:hypothetical protein